MGKFSKQRSGPPAKTGKEEGCVVSEGLHSMRFPGWEGSHGIQQGSEYPIPSNTQLGIGSQVFRKGFRQNRVLIKLKMHRR